MLEKLLDDFEIAAIKRYESLQREGNTITVDVERDVEYQRLRAQLLENLKG